MSRVLRPGVRKGMDRRPLVKGPINRRHLRRVELDMRRRERSLQEEIDELEQDDTAERVGPPESEVHAYLGGFDGFEVVGVEEAAVVASDNLDNTAARAVAATPDAVYVVNSDGDLFIFEPGSSGTRLDKLSGFVSDASWGCLQATADRLYIRDNGNDTVYAYDLANLNGELWTKSGLGIGRGVAADSLNGVYISEVAMTRVLADETVAYSESSGVQAMVSVAPDRAAVGEQGAGGDGYLLCRNENGQERWRRHFGNSENNFKFHAWSASGRLFYLNDGNGELHELDPDDGSDVQDPVGTGIGTPRWLEVDEWGRVLVAEASQLHIFDADDGFAEVDIASLSKNQRVLDVDPGRTQPFRIAE